MSELSANVKMQIVCIQVSTDLIYGLNFNNSNSKLYAEDQHERENLKIQVFDWEGNPISEYILDDKFIIAFAVDPIHNRIYGYAPNLEDNLVIYEM